DDPVVLRYLRQFPQEVVRLEPEQEYAVNGLSFTTTPRHVHQVETFGFRFGDRLGWVTDSAYYDGIAEQHKADVMVIHLVLMQCRVVLDLAGVVVGLLPGTPLPRIGGDILLIAFVPGLVFEAALTLDLAELKRRLLPVSLLVTVGVALTVVLIGALTHLLVGFSWADGMLLGAILAATDPIAVVTLLRRVKAPAGLASILEGESLLNDGTGVAVFAAVLGTIIGGSPSAGDAGLRFVVLTAGGAVVGLAVGFLGLALLRFAEDASLEVLATMTVGYRSYLVADVRTA